MSFQSGQSWEYKIKQFDNSADLFHSKTEKKDSRIIKEYMFFKKREESSTTK
jgi:hypothetical protein